jgi:HD-like signal output (HDOD) protein
LLKRAAAPNSQSGNRLHGTKLAQLKSGPCVASIFVCFQLDRSLGKSPTKEITVNPVTYDILTQRVKQLGNLPAMPCVLSSLTEALSLPPGKIDIEKVVETICYDKSLTAQVLRLANSALFRQRGDVATVRDAVIALGLWRIRDLAFSCNLPLMFPALSNGVGKEVFWRHAFGTAVVSQKLGSAFATGNQVQTYLCGLLHDIGMLVNALLFPDDFHELFEEAVADKIPIEVVEQRVLGFTHGETGKILAERWRLPLIISETIEYHHHPQDQQVPQHVTLLVHAADLFCQEFGLGYGYVASGASGLTPEHIWGNFCRAFPRAQTFPAAEFPALICGYIEEATRAADDIFGIVAATNSSHNY